MNFVGIDPSLISTGIVVNGKMFNYCRESDAFNKTGMTKWFKACEHLVEYKYINYRKFKDYSEGEITKLMDYDQITDQIISDILRNIDQSQETYIGIEGFSFNSKNGDLVDLVTFSTLLRKKLYDKVSKNINVLSPSSLKLESCKMTYDPIDVGVKKPKLEYRNNEGVAGGKFTKREIFLSIIENKSFDDEWTKHLKFIKDDMLEMKSIKKPYEDINDAFMLYKIMKNLYVIN